VHAFSVFDNELPTAVSIGAAASFSPGSYDYRAPFVQYLEFASGPSFQPFSTGPTPLRQYIDYTMTITGESVS
jgi:hypothetical protein